jgi:hypothetical protein
MDRGLELSWSRSAGRYRIGAGMTQVPNRLIPLARHCNKGQRPRSRQPRQGQCIALAGTGKPLAVSAPRL